MKRTSHIIISLGVKEGVKIEKKQSVIRETKINTKKEIEEKKEEIKTPSKTINKKPVKEMTMKPKKQNWAKRIFRRKSI
jgi:hypothetical protein